MHSKTDFEKKKDNQYKYRQMFTKQSNKYI